MTRHRATAKDYGIFVGINNYLSPRLESLNYCVNDAVEMRDTLTNEATGLVSRETSTLLTDAEATKSRVMKVIGDAVRNLRRDDSVTIYWACHGTRPQWDRSELYLVTHDTHVTDNEIRNAVKFIEELVPLFQQVDGQVKVILDGCEVGDALARPVIAENENVGIMAATKREEKALEAKPLKHGVFTYHLLQTLCSTGVDAERDNLISMEAAHAYTYKPVVDYVTTHFPGHPQHPTVAGHRIHRMVLIKQAQPMELIRAR